VEYALENVSSPLGVSEYQIANAVPEDLKGSLPSIEELEQELGESIHARVKNSNLRAGERAQNGQ
jgi:hypothetical protein